MKTEDKRQIMNETWKFVKISGCNLSEALKLAWQLYYLKKRMRLEIVKFYFQKIDGTTREAYGHLMLDKVPIEQQPKGYDRSDKVFTYFDTERNEWRCFKKLNFLRIA